MIDDAMRAALLGQFPPGTPLVAVTAGTRFYEDRAAVDPSFRVIPFSPAASDGLEGANVIVDGLDRLGDPGALLRSLRAVAPHARVFALVGNGANAHVIAGLIDGTLDRMWHPIVKAELAPLFTENGWNVLDIAAFPDPSLVHAPSLPIELRVRKVGITVRTAEERDRVITAGYVVVADAA